MESRMQKTIELAPVLEYRGPSDDPPEDHWSVRLIMSLVACAFVLGVAAVIVVRLLEWLTVPVKY